MTYKKLPRALALFLALLLALAPGLTAYAAPLDELREALDAYYIDPIPQEVLALGEIDQITDALGDPYTYYMTAEQYQSFADETNGDETTVGIGVTAEARADGVYLLKIAPGSPAEQSGLQIGDLIVTVDGVHLEEAGSSEALMALIRGEEGTQVGLTYLRDGELRSLTLARAPFTFPILTHEIRDGHINWVTSSSFGETSGAEFGAYVRNADPATDRWVLDLRGNSGGYSDAAIQMTSYLVGNRDVCYVVNKNYDIEAWRADDTVNDGGVHIEDPAILLVDHNSASATELLTAAVRDYGSALIIGETTFGKGIGQGLIPLSDGSTLRVTAFRYYSPGYVTPDHTGILPDLVVDADLAPGVAYLLSGKPAEAPRSDVLTVRLAGFDWYVHKTDATGAYRGAFAALLSALPADAALTLAGKSVSAADVSAAWGVDYESRLFGDLDGSPYAEAIDHLSTLGLVSGTDGDIFAPGDGLTRAQLCALLTQAMNYWVFDDGKGVPFTDVTEDDWFYVPVLILYDMGLVQGVSDTLFDPNAPVTNEQFYTILARMGAKADLTIQRRLNDLTANQGAQAAGFAPWAQPAAALGQQLGYLAKPLPETAPAAPVTRGEAAAAVYGLMHYMGVIRTEESSAK